MATLKKKDVMNANEVIAQVAEERNAAPKMSDLQDEYDLIAGYTDEKGKLHKTFSIRPLNGEDEEVISRHKNSPMVKLYNLLLSRCLLTLGDIDFQSLPKSNREEILNSMYTADIDVIILRLREVSVGEELELRHKCPKCGQSITTRLSVDEVKVVPWDGERGIPFELPVGIRDEQGNVHKTGIIRYSTNGDRNRFAPIAQRDFAKGKTIMILNLTEFDDDFELTEQIVRKMTMRDREYLIKLSAENQFGLDLKIPVECPECGNEFEGGLNITNFI